METFKFLGVIVTLILSIPNSEGKGQYVQPLNMGMQVAIPYDITNIVNRPINFGPISALISTGCLLYILFFGVITSLFGYFFGVPSEKYVLGDTWPIKEQSDKVRSLGDDSTQKLRPHITRFW